MNALKHFINAFVNYFSLTHSNLSLIMPNRNSHLLSWLVFLCVKLGLFFEQNILLNGNGILVVITDQDQPVFELNPHVI